MVKQMKNLSGINLNQLVVLDALLTELNTTRAGKKLKISQSAVSNTLKNLRLLFEDELLVRGKRSSQMELTLKARRLKEPIRKMITSASEIFSKQEIFDPQQTKRNFRIGMTDYIARILLPRLINMINGFSSNINISVYQINYTQVERAFEENDLDIAIGIFDSLAKNFCMEKLFEENNFVCIANKNHPAFKSKKLTFKTVSNYPCIIPVFYENYQFTSHRIISLMGEIAENCKKSVIKIPYITAAIDILKDGDYIYFIPEKLAYKYKKFHNIAVKSFPASVEKRTFSLCWKKHNNNDAGLIWLKDKILEAVEK